MLVIILLNVAQVLVREFIIFILSPDDAHRLDHNKFVRVSWHCPGSQIINDFELSLCTGGV